MSLRKNGIFITVAVVIIIIVISLMLNSSSTQTNELITIITAVLGFLVIIYQLLQDHKIKKAEFIYNLNDTFNNDPLIAEVYMKLKKDRDEGTEFDKEDGRKMGNYIMFFIILEYLIRESFVTIQMVDTVFANKFFIFCNNHAAYEYQLKYTDINKPVLVLYEKWYNYRIKNSLKNLYEEHELAGYEDLFQKESETSKMIKLIK